MYLCCVESLSEFRSQLDFLQIYKVAKNFGQRPGTIVHDFSARSLHLIVPLALKCCLLSEN